ncbi:MAG: hypothetical protein QOI80_3335 [Solirubrobacteraceae bacterium]|nr:hypothetical protein [Solirubrobacteraceae bacterium]
MSSFSVGLREEMGGPHGEEVRRVLLDALGNPPATEPDETGTLEVTVEAGSFDDALLAVWNALAASGAEEHILFIEHPDLPGHWRRVPR